MGEYFSDLKGKYVEIYVSSQNGESLFVEKGILINRFFIGGDNAVFVVLDNGCIINARYIVKIVLK